MPAYALLPAAKEWLREHLFASPASDGAKRYRYEHCLRVARIGKQVAQGAGLDEAALELGCLLHDVGKYDAAVPVDHGRAGAFLVKEFFAENQYEGPLADEIVQGIAMHVDGQWNPRVGMVTAEGAVTTNISAGGTVNAGAAGAGGGADPTEGSGADAAGREYLHFSRMPGVLARSIGDCDNVDRFSTYRIADTLRYVDFMNLSTQEQNTFAENYLAQLAQERNYKCATQTAQQLWNRALDFQEEFFRRLAAEL